VRNSSKQSTSSNQPARDFVDFDHIFSTLFAASDLIMCRGEHRIESKNFSDRQAAHEKSVPNFSPPSPKVSM
jgi:hypothetical protein